LVAW